MKGVKIVPTTQYKCLSIAVFLFFLTGVTPEIFSQQFAVEDPIVDIIEFNQSEIENKPSLFLNKMNEMKKNSFSFLRGTAHLMNEDLNFSSELEFIRKAPKGMITGDLHMHNFSVHNIPGHSPTYLLDDHDEAYITPLFHMIFLDWQLVW